MSAGAPRIEMVCVGTELLGGHVNTHTSYVGSRLAEVGLRLRREHTVGDDRAAMTEVFRESVTRADVVLCAGGLGPTFDDITREIWSAVLGRPLRFNDDLFGDIAAKFRKREIAMPPMNRRQAFLLEGASVIPNAHGTAPGQWFEAKSKIVILLPGPARELYPMMDQVVLPGLRTRFSRRTSRLKAFLIFGVPESTVDQRIRPFVKRYAHVAGCRVTHGILASQSIVTVKFIVEGSSDAVVQRTVERLSRKARSLLGKWIFGEDQDTLASVVARLLTRAKRTVATAESCTGGLLAKKLTDMPGASLYFREGVVTYANDAKRKLLGVPAETLRRHGAVSREVARDMAEGLRERADVDLAVSITGVAGPDGGTLEKPVGLVFIGVASRRSIRVHEFRFTGDRGGIRERAALTALDLLRRQLQS